VHGAHNSRSRCIKKTNIHGGVRVGLIPEIKQKIDDWLNAEPGRSISSLATLAGIHYSTARRILQNENLPTYETIVAILGVVDKNANLTSLLSRQYPDGNNRLISAFKSNPVDLSFFRGLDSLSNLIFAFLINSRDSSMEEINKEFGNAGLKALNTLVERGLVESTDGVLRPKMREICLTAPFDVMNMISSHLDHTNMENIGNSMGLAGILWDCTTIDGYKKILKISTEALASISNVMKECPGQVPVYSTCLVNSYLTLSNEKLRS
jgi:hypothetical protein